jgi:hypothetical protein
MIVYFCRIFTPNVLEYNEERYLFPFTIHYVHYHYRGLPTGEQLLFVYENNVPDLGMFG